MTLNEVLRQSDLKFLKRFIKKLYPAVKLNWHHLKIIQLLENAALNPNKKYTISMPPRHGKSLLCSEIFPAWYLANNPEKKVIACSYGASLASDFGRKVRNYMQSEAVTELTNKKLLSQDSKSVNRFNTIQGGTYIAVGSGGSLTGFGGNCFPAGVKVQTINGPKNIEDISVGDQVLSYDHKNNKTRFNRVQAKKSRKEKGLWELRSGKSGLISTKCHRIYTPEQGYQAASTIKTGQEIIKLHEMPEETKRQKVELSNEYSKAEHIVYDIQVRRDNNFFANEILVHNCIICDDLQKSIEDASNDSLTEKLFEWFTSTLYTRLQPNGSIVVIGTRWHENDIIGRIKQNDKDNTWEHLVIPAISEDGESLWEEWIPKTKLLEIKEQIGTYNFNALYQQDPTPQTGNIIKKEWIQTIETPVAFTDVCISWDLAFKGNDNSDYCVGQLWGRAHNKFYLIDQVRRKIDFVETTTAFDEFYKKNSKYKPTTILVEDAANGAALYSHFKTKYPFIKLIKPIKSKELRVLKVSPIFENKNIFLTTNLSIEQRETITSEILKFPNAVNDDIVDASTQAIDFLSSRNQIGSSFSTGGESVLSF